MKSKNTSIVKQTKSRLPREQRIADISNTAREVFIEHGYEKATVSEIAKRLGIVEGTIFSYFGTKRELMFQVIRQWYESQSGKIDRGLAGIQGADNRLRFVIWRHLTTIFENIDLCGVILLEARKPSRKMSDFLHQLNKEYTAPLISVLTAGIQSGEYRSSVSVFVVRNTVFGSIEHAMWDALNHDKQVDIEEYTEQLTQFVLAGLKPAPMQTNDVDWEAKFIELQQMIQSLVKSEN